MTENCHSRAKAIDDVEGRALTVRFCVCRQAGHMELAERLVECQYELTDRLAFYLCGRRPGSEQHTFSSALRSAVTARSLHSSALLFPDHKNGHYIIPQMADRYDDVTSWFCLQVGPCHSLSLLPLPGVRPAFRHSDHWPSGSQQVEAGRPTLFISSLLPNSEFPEFPEVCGVHCKCLPLNFGPSTNVTM